MMKTVKHTFSSIGDRGTDIAGDLASGTVDLARRFGSGTAGLAKRVGPRRGLIGLAVFVAAVGGSVVLIRYLRSRRAAEAAASNDDTFTSKPSSYGSHTRPANSSGAPVSGTH